MPWVNKKKCVSCKKCVKKCPVDAIDMVKGKALIKEDKCINCGKCIKICPVKAILKDKEIVKSGIASNIKDAKKSLSEYKSKKAKKRVIKSQMRQLKRQQKILWGTMKELKHIKL
ncbi:4Fe-4S binding protein [Methanolobus bombayensis]|uniref:4Fe-4S binding protein n=1 Tax=Methanolobus bombayensis TaxID=38023 RepID=UPI001AEB512D|nr:4Fe-4S binding protein [Methanolobus bombayensis]MBP1909882.1 Fe-S-cluster-containing hydrogenase component 2 [Methanolobus bombayensis]